MAAASPFLHTFVLLFALAAQWAGAVSISFGQWGSLQDSQALAAQIAMPAGSGENCVQGKHLPEFYVLGAQKAATTSLSEDLRSRGVVAAPGNTSRKEWGFFMSNLGVPAAIQHAKWLENLPDCGALPAVMGDFAVPNLFLMPLPSDFAWSQDFGLPTLHQAAPENFEAAKLIRQFYGGGGGRLPKFVVMLREPLARLQSEYYMFSPVTDQYMQESKKGCLGCKANGTFAGSFATNVVLLQHQPPLMSDWFWKSCYARQIEEYFKYFDAKQFFFAPDKEYFAVDPPKFSADLLAWLHIPSPPWHEAHHSNSREHPELDEDLPSTAPARKAYEAFMAPENKRLVRTLAQAHTQGAVLAGYAGLPGDVAAVQDWLLQSW